MRGLLIARVLHGPAAPLPLLRPDPQALAKAATLPHIPVALRGCWQAVVAPDRLSVSYATAGVTPRRIAENFSTAVGQSRPTLTRTLSLGPDDLGTPVGHLRLAGGEGGSRAFTRCT